MPEVDQVFLEEIRNHVMEHLKTEEERAMFLSNLSFLREQNTLTAEKKEAVSRFLGQYYFPVENGKPDRALFEARMAGLISFREGVYRGVADCYEHEDYPRDDQRSRYQFLEKIDENEAACYGYKTEALIRGLSDSMSGRSGKEQDAFRNLELPEETDSALVQEEIWKAAVTLGDEKWDCEEVQERVPKTAGEKEQTPSGLLAVIIGTFSAQSLSGKDESDKRKINSGWEVNPGVPGYAGEADEIINELPEKKGKLAQSTAKECWSFVERPVRRAVLQYNGGSEYFLSGVEKDQKKAKLSFGRKGSRQFQEMEKSVNALKEALKEFEKKDSMTGEDAKRLSGLCEEVREKAKLYCEFKTGSKGPEIDLSRISNSSTRSRLAYAIRAIRESDSLSETFRKSENEKTRGTEQPAHKEKGAGNSQVEKVDLGFVQKEQYREKGGQKEKPLKEADRSKEELMKTAPEKKRKGK